MEPRTEYKEPSILYEFCVRRRGLSAERRCGPRHTYCSTLVEYSTQRRCSHCTGSRRNKYRRCRLDNQGTSFPRLSFVGPNPHCVKAIKHFTTVQKVDIISMSFGFPLLEPSLDGLNKALLEAHRADIVLFAAGHNSGGRKRVSFPANQDHVICIGACDGLNWSSSFNPSRIHNMFCTLGENIVTPWQTAGSLSKSGTSYATPIAAGIAAVVMDWMIHESRSWSQEDQRHSRKVRTKSGIVKIFQEKLSEERNGYRVLVPWALFNEDSIGYAKGVLLDILINM